MIMTIITNHQASLAGNLRKVGYLPRLRPLSPASAEQPTQCAVLNFKGHSRTLRVSPHTWEDFVMNRTQAVVYLSRTCWKTQALHGVDPSARLLMVRIRCWWNLLARWKENNEQMLIIIIQTLQISIVRSRFHLCRGELRPVPHSMAPFESP